MLGRLLRVKKQFPGVSMFNFMLLETYRRIRTLLFSRGMIDSSGMMALKRRRLWDIDDSEVRPGKPDLVCLSGFGFSGSSVIVDLLWEYDGVYSNGGIEPDGSVRKHSDAVFDFEFHMLRSTFGIFGFERFLNSNFFADGDQYVHMFISMVAHYYYNEGFVFHEKFIEYTREFLGKILQFKVRNPASAMYDGFYPAVGNRGSKLLWGTDDDYMYALKRMTVHEFRAIAREYIAKILSLIPYRGKYVMDQIVSDGTGDIDKYLDYLGDVKIIAIRRDPRDVLANARRAGERWVPFDVDEFIFWYRVANQGYFGKIHPNLLSLTFEGVVKDYEQSCRKVEQFLGLQSSQHVRKFQAFDPKVSEKNIGIYKEFLTEEESTKISTELKEFCI